MRINVKGVTYIFDNSLGEDTIKACNIQGSEWRVSKDIYDKLLELNDNTFLTSTENFCHECQYYEVEYEESYAFDDYVSISQESCVLGHDISSDCAVECEDYIYNDKW